MTCNCLGTCSCSIRLSQLAETKTLADSSMFVLASGKTVSVKSLRDNLMPSVAVSDLSLLPDGTVPMVQGGVLVASSMVEDDDAITSAKDIDVPPGSIGVGDGVRLTADAAGLRTESAAVQSRLLSHAVDDTQSYAPKWPALGAISTYNMQTVATTAIESTSISWPLVFVLSDPTAYRLDAIRIRASAAVSGIQFVVSVGSAPLVDGSNVIYAWPQREQWISGEGHAIVPGDNEVSADGITIDSTRTYYVTLRVPVGSGAAISLLGDGSGVPYTRIDMQSGALENVITDSSMASYVSTAVEQGMAQGYISGSALTTTFAVADTPVKVNFGAAFIADIQEQVAIDTDGRLTAARAGTYFIQFDVHADVAGGIAREYHFYVAKNGAVIASSEQEERYSGSDHKSSAVATLATLDVGDYVELWVSSLGHTTGINVIGCSVKMFRVF